MGGRNPTTIHMTIVSVLEIRAIRAIEFDLPAQSIIRHDESIG